MRLRIALLFLLLLASCQKKEETVKKTPPTVTVEKAKQEKTILYNSYVGHVQPTVQVNVTAQVEGVLTGYYFTEGDEVKGGDLLFTIDSRPYVAQLAKAEGALAESIANLRYAEDVVRRNAPLARDDFVSQVQYDQYLTSVMTYKAEIQQNEADIETAKINISYCSIHAPIDAVTGKLQINVGNLIKNAGETPLVTLNKITPTYTYFSVPQKDLPHIMKLHRDKALEVKAFLNQNFDAPFEGLLDLIDNEVNDQTGSIWLRGIFPNEEKLLWPGEFVDVRLMLEELDAIFIPTQAVTNGQEGKFVFIIKENNVAEKRKVETGQIMGENTIIKSGVKAGEKVVSFGQINLSDGIEVHIKFKEGK